MPWDIMVQNDLPGYFYICYFSVIKDLLEHTILRGEGDSMVIVGDSGVGKTWVNCCHFNTLHHALLYCIKWTEKLLD